MKVDIKSLNDTQKAQLVDTRWTSSSEIWDTVSNVYKQNTGIYENRSDWVNSLPQRRKNATVQANRVFVNMEAVINSLIANPPGINILPAREGEVAQDFARRLETFFRKRYADLNTKETLRMGLRNLYFGRLLVVKPFWNPLINDFDFRAIDPRKVRFGKYAKNEAMSEFAIEEIDDNLCALCERFPEKKQSLMSKFGIDNDADLYIKNPDVKYKEAWIGDYVIFKYDNIILDCVKNPYWDWDGILITEEEEGQINELEGQPRRDYLAQIKSDQPNRQPAQTEEPGMMDKIKSMFVKTPEGTVEEQVEHKAYYFNYFDTPRKPYIFATVFNNENSPIGRTDMITLSAQLQKGIDKRKMDIDENCELVNGVIKVDAEVMSKSDAQRIRFETKGIIWGKGVVAGVQREHGTPLPAFVQEDMLDSRSEIDNIMAATSAFRGERQGQETKAGRLALIQQSYLRLNELVQVVDYVSKEMFDWGFQLAKTRYTEYHYAKWMGKEGAQESIELIQDDFETGSEVTIIAGKTLPVDNESMLEQAQQDVKNGFLGVPDYLKIAQYNDPKDLAKNLVMWQQNPAMAVGIKPEEMALPSQPGELTPDQQISFMNAGLAPTMSPGAEQPMPTT